MTLTDSVAARPLGSPRCSLYHPKRPSLCPEGLSQNSIRLVIVFLFPKNDKICEHSPRIVRVFGIHPVHLMLLRESPSERSRLPSILESSGPPNHDTRTREVGFRSNLNSLVPCSILQIFCQEQLSNPFCGLQDSSEECPFRCHSLALSLLS